MPNTIPITPVQAASACNGAAPTLDGLLCADTGCRKRTAPSLGEVAAAIYGDNALSEAIEARITGILREHVMDRITAQNLHIDTIEDKIDTNSAAIERLEQSTAGIVILMASWEGALATIERIGKVLKPLTWIIGFFSAVFGLWATMRGLRGE